MDEEVRGWKEKKKVKRKKKKIENIRVIWIFHYFKQPEKSFYQPDNPEKKNRSA